MMISPTLDELFYCKNSQNNCKGAEIPSDYLNDPFKWYNLQMRNYKEFTKFQCRKGHIGALC